MSWMNRLLGSLRKSGLEEQLDDELRFHIEMRTQEFVAAGMTAEEARQQAARLFGNQLLLKESTREMDTVAWLETLLQDLRYALRMLRRSPGFVVAAVLSLALAIGANTAIFSALDAVLLRTLPVEKPGELVRFSQALPTQEMSEFTYPMFEKFRDHNRSFAGLIAYLGARPFSVVIGGQGEIANTEFISANYYSVLGLKALVGRTFTPQDDRISDNPPVAMISFAYWQRRFSGDAMILGRQVSIHGVPFTVIGVTPPRFFGITVGSYPDITLPFATWERVAGRPDDFQNRYGYFLQIVARLKPGVSVTQARAEAQVLYDQELADSLKAASQSLRGYMQKETGNARLMVLSAGGGAESGVRGLFSYPLKILMVMVGLLLLIACANLANLLLSRATARGHEIAIRLAIGASRPRLVRQLLTESLLLSAIGAAAGLLLAIWGIQLLVTMISKIEETIVLPISVDGRILAFTAGVAVVATILFGLLPALRATRLDVSRSLKPAGLRSAIRSQITWGKVLVISQVALSLPLLVGAGLFAGSLRNLYRLDLGFNRDNLMFVSLDAGSAGYKPEKAAPFYRELLTRMSALPAVKSIAYADRRPLSSEGFHQLISVDGYHPRPNEQMAAGISYVSPSYFQTLQMPIIRGRSFERLDTDKGAPQVALISQSTARAWFAVQNPVGRRLGFGFTDSARDIEVIGVVRDSKYNHLREPAPLMIYVPYRLGAAGGITVIIRAGGSPEGLIEQVRREIRALDPALPITHLTTMAVQLEESLGRERLIASLSSFFSLVALLLASIGLYGVMAYAVARRTSEIGIRMALGAEHRSILRMVMRETLLLVIIGAAIGISAALASTRLVSSMLFGLEPTDPMTLATATGVMLAVAACAGYLPARRASRVDPTAALRYE